MGNRGKRIVYTMRDEWMFTSVYVAGELTTEHLAKMYFPSKAYLQNRNTSEQRYSIHGAEERLRLLQKYNNVKGEFFYPGKGQRPIKYWRLLPGGYLREAKDAGRWDESQTKVPKRMMHHFKINDIYAAIHPRLEEVFEDGPEWQWKRESHAFLRTEYSGQPLVHQPDAEVHFPDGRVYFLERQTKESRKIRAVFNEKARGYRRYVNFKGYDKGQAKVLFACDEQRDMEYADTAIKEFDIDGVVTDPEDAVNYIIEKAKESKWARAASSKT